MGAHGSLKPYVLVRIQLAVPSPSKGRSKYLGNQETLLNFYLSTKSRKGWGRVGVGGRKMGYDPKRKPIPIICRYGGMADTRRLERRAERCAGSSPVIGTNTGFRLGYPV